MIRVLTFAALALIAGGLILAIAGISLIGGILLVLAGLALEVVLAVVSKARAISQSFREWRSLLRGGVQRVRVVSVQPPPGWLVRHDATVTLELTGKDGQVKQVQRDFPVPRLQALMWQLGKRAPGAGAAGSVAQSFGARLQVQLDRAVALLNRRRRA